MSGQLTRTSLDKAGKGNTDWERLRRMTDEEIDRAIADDPDTWALTDEDLAAIRRAGRANVAIKKGKDGRFRWYLLSADGDVLATDSHGATTKARARASLLAARMAMLGVNLDAA